MKSHTLKLTEKEAQALISAYALGVEDKDEIASLTRKIIALDLKVNK